MKSLGFSEKCCFSADDAALLAGNLMYYDQVSSSTELFPQIELHLCDNSATIKVTFWFTIV